ncbi:MAG: hypothetical protein HY078_00895 [Elusimicrobia bacterium]|nr:hypothetical protein [Elusimicrobiota bacterium]
MQFFITAYDGLDDKALERRMAARQAHIERGDRLREEGKLLYAAAILDDAERMIGSLMIYDAADRAELDRLIKEDPYVAGNVWQKIDVRRCKTGPTFAPKR